MSAAKEKPKLPPVPAEMVDGDEQSTSSWRVLVSADGDVTIRVDRLPGSGRALYETLVLSVSEADALLTALMNEIG